MRGRNEEQHRAFKRPEAAVHPKRVGRNQIAGCKWNLSSGFRRYCA